MLIEQRHKERKKQEVYIDRVYIQACILQRAADHIKSLETEKLKLQSQNEQFRILIKSFQIDSTSVLQAQRRLSTNGKNQNIKILFILFYFFRSR